MLKKRIICFLAVLTMVFVSVRSYALDVFEYDIAHTEETDHIFSQGLLLYRETFDGPYGYKNVRDAVAIKAKYADAKRFSEGLAPVAISGNSHFDSTPHFFDGKYYGYINAAGTYVLPPQYYHAEPFHNGKAVVCGKDGYFIIDKTGKRLTDFYDAISAEGNGYIVQKKRIHQWHKGYLNGDLEVVLPVEYFHFQHFSDNYFVISERQDYAYALEVSSGKRVEVEKFGTYNHNVYQIYDGKVARYEETEDGRLHTVISDFDGNLIWQDYTSSVPIAWVLPGGYLKIGPSGWTGEGESTVSTIRRPDGREFRTPEGKYTRVFGRYLLACEDRVIDNFGSVKPVVVDIYDYDGHRLTSGDYDFYLPTAERVYGVKDQKTDIFDLDFHMLGTSDIALSAHNDVGGILNSTGLGGIRNRRFSLIYEKDGLLGICDTDFNILVEAQYEFLMDRFNSFETSYKYAGNGVEVYEVTTEYNITKPVKHIYVYNETGQFPEVIEHFYSITESVEVTPLRLEIGKPTVETPDGTIYIDPNNHEVVPILEYDWTLVPMRFITEQIRGATVSWDGSTNKATFTIPGRTVTVQENSSTAVLKEFNELTREFDEKTYSLGAAVRIINGRTFVPLRAVSELLGIYIDYDDATGIISVK